jgi:hypothetical protein
MDRVRKPSDVKTRAVLLSALDGNVRLVFRQRILASPCDSTHRFMSIILSVTLISLLLEIIMGRHPLRDVGVIVNG